MPQDAWQNFGWVYGRSGVSRGTSTSSAVLTIESGFARRVVSGFAWDVGNGLRNSNADPAASTDVGTYAFYRWISVNTSSPTVARFRAYRSATISAASAVTTLSRKETLATAITGLIAGYQLFGY